jgi:hypothetical protein
MAWSPAATSCGSSGTACAVGSGSFFGVIPYADGELSVVTVGERAVYNPLDFIPTNSPAT